MITVNNVKMLDKPIKAEIRAISEKEDGRKYLIIYAESPREEVSSTAAIGELYLALELSFEGAMIVESLMRNSREMETPCVTGIVQGERKVKTLQPKEQEKVGESKGNT